MIMLLLVLLNVNVWIKLMMIYSIDNYYWYYWWWSNINNDINDDNDIDIVW